MQLCSVFNMEHIYKKKHPNIDHRPTSITDKLNKV